VHETISYLQTPDIQTANNFMLPCLKWIMFPLKSKISLSLGLGRVVSNCFYRITE